MQCALCTVRVDSAGFHIRATKQHERHTLWESFKLVKDNFWRRHFDVKKVETKGHKFNYTIITDGVAVWRGPYNHHHRGIRIENIEKKFAANVYEKIIGCDPGLKLIFGVVKLENGIETNTKFKANRFRTECGEFKRTWKMNKQTQRMIDRIEMGRVCQYVPISEKSCYYSTYWK